MTEVTGCRKIRKELQRPATIYLQIVDNTAENKTRKNKRLSLIIPHLFEPFLFPWLLLGTLFVFFFFFVHFFTYIFQQKLQQSFARSRLLTLYWNTFFVVFIFIRRFNFLIVCCGGVSLGDVFFLINIMENSNEWEWQVKEVERTN